MTEQTATLTFSFTLTPSAIEAVKNIMKSESMDGQHLRVAVLAGGCSGFSYDLSFTDEKTDRDITLTFDSLEVLIDNACAAHLNGVTLDYVNSLQGAGFSFKNPNATANCGCGSSFSA